jgi:hypothetical protein
MMAFSERAEFAKELKRRYNYAHYPTNIEFRSSQAQPWQSIGLNVSQILFNLLTTSDEYRFKPESKHIYRLRTVTGHSYGSGDYHCIEDAREAFNRAGFDYQAVALWNITTNELLDFKNISKQTEELIKNV